MGVASGDPDHKSVILWTRLGPKPLEPGGGMPDHPVEVRWEVATDDSFKKIITSGKNHRDFCTRVFSPYRGSRPEAGSLVLLPFSGRRCHQPNRSDPHHANPGCQPRKTPLRCHLLPTLGARSLHCLPANGSRPTRPCLSPRRLHLRIRQWPRWQSPAPSWPRDRNA